MHSHDRTPSAAQVRALLSEQMPDLAALPLRRVGQAGTDNALFRLGPRLVLRFPRLPHAADQLTRMTALLPGLAAALPLPVPVPLRLGRPGAGYPFPWMVTAWLPGHPAPPRLSDPAVALALAEMIRRLHARPAPAGTIRREGDEPALRLSALEAFIPKVVEADPARLLSLLHRLRPLPPHAGPLVLSHGDLHPLNLLMRRGRLVAVIDWGNLCLGDPAMDLLPAFMAFDGPARAAFLRVMNPAPGALERARAVALSKVVHGLPYYRSSNPSFHAILLATLGRLWPD